MLINCHCEPERSEGARPGSRDWRAGEAIYFEKRDCFVARPTGGGTHSSQ